MAEDSLKRRKILIVDDEERMIRFIRLNLEHDGFVVAEAFNGKQALQRLRDSTPDLILLPTTFRARELAAMSAIDLNTGVLVDVIALEADGEKLTATRPIYEGKLFEKIVCAAKPQLITLRGRAFPRPAREAGRSGTPTKVAAKADALTTVEGYAASEIGVSLGDAGVIVSGGRGVSNNPSLGLDEKETAKKGTEARERHKSKGGLF